ncbi:hypothetical protein AIZ02_23065, partial [Salmonella enterica subsp. enterica serovar Typhimurium]
WLMMSLWDALRMNMMISYQELVRTFPRAVPIITLCIIFLIITPHCLLSFKKITIRRRNIEQRK